MVGLSGANTASVTEGFNGAGIVSTSNVITNTESTGAPFSWLGTGNGGYAILTSPSIGTLSVTQNTAAGEGGLDWTFSVDSDDPALDSLDAGDSIVVSFTVRVTDFSWNGTPGDYILPGGTVVGEAFTVSITIFGQNEVCFTRGTEISTPSGMRLIEDLKAGDMVVTRDNGVKPIKWIASSKVSNPRRQGNHNLEPIVIAANAIAPGVPIKDLKVSPQHRILLSGVGCDLLFAEPVMLASAKSLLNDTSIRYCGEDFDELEYWHMMFDDHEIVYANACPAESFYLGDIAEDTLNDRQLAELREIFPAENSIGKHLAFPQLKNHEVTALMALSETA